MHRHRHRLRGRAGAAGRQERPGGRPSRASGVHALHAAVRCAGECLARGRAAAGRDGTYRDGGRQHGALVALCGPCRPRHRHRSLRCLGQGTRFVEEIWLHGGARAPDDRRADSVKERSVMSLKVAINGYGRIGRNILRALYEGQSRGQLQIVAINDLADAQTNAHLTRHDTVHGRFRHDVRVDGDAMLVDGDRIQVLAERDPAKLPWRQLGVQMVLECTGLFTSKAKAAKHLEGGAAKVLISAPGGDDVDATVVYGVNDKVLRASHTVVSNASCTTNCLVPLAKVLHDGIGIVAGLMTTVHSYTNDQVLTDVYHKDLRRARSATHSMIPTKTGAAAAIGLVLPELKGKFDGFSVGVASINKSLVDLTFTPRRATSVKEVNELLRTAANGPFKHILAYTEEQLVSVDYNHDAHSSIYDATMTRII